MKHGHAAEVPRPALEAHRTRKRVRLWCDAVFVASAVTDTVGRRKHAIGRSPPSGHTRLDMAQQDILLFI